MKLSLYSRIVGSRIAKYIVSGATLILAMLGTPAFAQVVYSQSGSFDGGQNLTFCPIGIDFVSPGNFSNVDTLGLFGINSAGGSVAVSIWDSFSSQYLAQDVTTVISTTLASTTHLLNIGSVDFVSGRSYVIGLIATSSGNVSWAYSDNSQSGIVRCYGSGYNMSPSSSPFGNDASIWFDLRTTDTSTRIISQISPLNGSLEPDTNVTFEFTYFNNSSESPLYTDVGYELNDVTNAIQSEYSEPIVASGGVTFSHDEILSSGAYRLWRPFLISASSSVPLYGDWYSFDVVYRSASSTPFLNPIISSSTVSYLESFCNGVGSSTDPIYTADGFQYSICFSLGYFFVPSNESVNQFAQIPLMLQGKFPFQYFYEIKDIVSTGSQEDTPLGTLVIDLPLAGPVTLFSSSTINFFITEGVSDAVRPVTSGFLWILFAYSVYRMVLGIFKNKH